MLPPRQKIHPNPTQTPPFPLLTHNTAREFQFQLLESGFLIQVYHCSLPIGLEYSAYISARSSDAAYRRNGPDGLSVSAIRDGSTGLAHQHESNAAIAEIDIK
jgi:hypothetical protein